MNPEDQERLYLDLDDKEYTILKDLNTQHVGSWKNITPGTTKKELLAQLDEQLISLFTHYKGPAFRTLGSFKCGGVGDENADIVILMRYPGTTASKMEDVMYSRVRMNRRGETFMYETEAQKVLRVLNNRGLADRTFYVAYVVPAKMPDGDPGKLLTTIFSNYVRRRIEIVAPKCVVAIRGWTTKFATGKFTFRGSETAPHLHCGRARKIMVMQIGGNRSMMRLTIARMIHPYCLNIEEHGHLKVEDNYETIVDPLIRVLKKATQDVVMRRMNRMSNGGNKIDAISLMTCGVKTFTTQQNAKRKRKNAFSLLKKKPRTSHAPSQCRLVLGSERDEDVEVIQRTAIDMETFPVDWVVDQYVGLIGKKTESDIRRDILRTKANIVITIDGRDVTELCDDMDCACITLNLSGDIDECITRELPIMSATSGILYSIDDDYTPPGIDLNHNKSFMLILIYKTVEDIMLRHGNLRNNVEMKHLPIVLIQTDDSIRISPDGRRITSHAYGDNRAYMMAAIVIYAIRDIISRIKNGLVSILGDGVKEVSPEMESRDGKPFDFVVEEIIIPPRRMYGKDNSPFVTYQGKKAKVKGLTSQTRESFEEREMLTIISMMNASIDIKSTWPGFTTMESKFLALITRYINDVEANHTFRDPVSVKAEIPYEDCVEEDTHDTSIVSTSPRSISNNPRDHTPPCRFCVCHIGEHGHKDMVKNECLVKECGTMFKWKDKHWRSTHKNDIVQRIPSLYSLALKVIRPRDMVPEEIDQLDLHPKDVLMEIYEDSLGSLELRKGCMCIICGGKGCN